MLYGHDKTIHRTTRLDVEVNSKGEVVAVWFRCMMLDFHVTKVDKARALEMDGKKGMPILAIEVPD